MTEYSGRTWQKKGVGSHLARYAMTSCLTWHTTTHQHRTKHGGFGREGTDSLSPANEEIFEVTPRDKTRNVPSLTCYEAAFSQTASSGIFVKNVGF